jgi:tRNA(Ile)-lysidine synthase
VRAHSTSGRGADPIGDRVGAYCARHELLPAGVPVLALVSGGADSLCLMTLLAERHDGRVGVLSLDHGLREGSAAEAGRVVALARDLGLPARAERLALAPGAGAPERARAARLAAARRAAARGGWARVATGHTASDQAETVLFRMARGSGRTGALGMAPRRGALVRPLLCLTAEETRRWCAERGLAPVDDPTNASLDLARGRVRHGLVPALAAVHPGAERHLAALADRLRDEAALLDVLVAEAWGRCAAGGGLDAARVLAEHPALRPLLARRLLARAGLRGEALAAEPVARVLALLRRGGRTEVVGAAVVSEGGRVLVVPNEEPAPVAADLPVPGVARFGDAVLRADRGPAAAPAPDRVAVRVDGPLRVRGPLPGDRMPLGDGGRQAVGRLLGAAGVPARLRPRVPVVVAGERVVWVAGHRAAPDLLAAPGEPAVVLELLP